MKDTSWNAFVLGPQSMLLYLIIQEGFSNSLESKVAETFITGLIKQGFDRTIMLFVIRFETIRKRIKGTRANKAEFQRG